MEWLFILVFGAITYLTEKAFDKESEKKGIGEGAVFLVDSGINTWLSWLFLHARGLAADELFREGTYFLTLNGKNVLLMGIFSILLGLAIAFVKSMKPQIEFDMDKPGIWSSLGEKKQFAAKGVILAVMFLTVVLLAAAPSIKQKQAVAVKAKFKTTVINLLEETKKETAELATAGTAAKDMGTLKVQGTVLEQVEKDQYWSGVSEDGKVHAVYMVDGNGNLVYISYKDKNYCATWSGPSSDEDFLKSHGGWNHGNGSGWSGSGIK